MHRFIQEFEHLLWRFQLLRERLRQYLRYVIWRLALALDRGQRLGQGTGLWAGWLLPQAGWLNVGLHALHWIFQPMQVGLKLILRLGGGLWATWNALLRLLPSLRYLIGVAKVALVGGFTLILLLAIEPYALSRWLWPAYAYDHERFSGTALLDANGVFLGYIPGHFDPLADYSMGDVLPADHKAIPVTNVPPVWRAVLYALEDRHHESWRSLHGIDLIAIVRAMTRDLFGSGRTSGASSLSMMLVRSMRHDAPDPRASWVGVLRRKLVELRDGPILHHNLSADDFDRWLAMHLPLIQGTKDSALGGSIYGLEAAGQVLFCRSAEQLTPGEQALLAAAVKQPILIGLPTEDATQSRINAIWERHKTRARYGLQNSGLSPAVIVQATEELDQLPPPAPCIPPVMASVLPDDPVKRFRTAADPARRAMHTLGYGGLAEVIGELQEANGYYWRRTVSRVQLTLDGVANARFQDTIKQSLAKVEQTLMGHLRQSLQMPLKEKKTADDEKGTEEQKTAIVLVAVADEQGRIVRFFSNRLDSAYVGGRPLRDAQGHYQRERETRRIASLGKMPLALLLAERGDHWNRWIYCNRALPPLTNPDGHSGVKSCSGPKAYYRPVEVFGASFNLPLLDTAKTLDNQKILALFDQFGLNYNPEVGPPHLALTLGRVTANPRTVQHMVGILYASLLNRPMPNELPHLTALPPSVTMVSPATTASPTPTLGHYMENPKQREFLWRTLSAALEPSYRGTLSALARYRASVGKDRQIRLAKTGTSTMESGVQDRWAVGGFWVEGAPYTALVLVGSSDASQPLGSGLNANQLLAPLLKVALESL